MQRYRLASRAHATLKKAAAGFRKGCYWRGYACVALLELEQAHGGFTEAQALAALEELRERKLLGQDSALSFWNRFACITERHAGKAPFVEEVV